MLLTIRALSSSVAAWIPKAHCGLDCKADFHAQYHGLYAIETIEVIIQSCHQNPAFTIHHPPSTPELPRPFVQEIAFVQVCVYIYIYLCVCVCKCVFVHLYLRACVYIQLHTCSCIHICIYIYRQYVCVCACARLRVCTAWPWVKTRTLSEHPNPRENGF